MSNITFASLWTVLAIILGGAVSAMTGSPEGLFVGFLAGVMISSSLGVTETSMSMDNAIINSSLVRKLNPFWRKMYLWVGMPISMLGMRFSMPIIVVSVATGLGLIQTLTLAIHHPDQYSAALNGSKYLIVGFGIEFLTLIFSDFFVDAEKDEHWVTFIERPLALLGKIPHVKYVISLLVLAITDWSFATNLKVAEGYAIAGLIGIVSYAVIKIASGYAERKAESGGSSIGLIQFLQIEIIDASFSFDGVIGAFAITQNIWLIMFGLSVGAVWVRVLTLKLADSKGIGQIKFLEHGAFWNIGALIVFMALGLSHEMPEWLSGALAIVIIGSAFAHSKLSSK